MRCRTRPLADRFWEKVNRDGPVHRTLGTACWLWTGATNHKGYGQLFERETRKHLMTHRLSYEMAFGPSPDGRFVCHRCDTPRCVRPDHLWLGSAADNTADMVAKGRRVHVVGEGFGYEKLTEQGVRELRSLYAAGAGSFAELAERFRVAKSTARQAINRDTWAHVP